MIIITVMIAIHMCVHLFLFPLFLPKKKQIIHFLSYGNKRGMSDKTAKPITA